MMKKFKDIIFKLTKNNLTQLNLQLSSCEYEYIKLKKL